jgi:hypothetical protein
MESRTEKITNRQGSSRVIYYDDIAASCAASILSPKAVKKRFTFSIAFG